jgi:hypothetical protein
LKINSFILHHLSSFSYNVAQIVKCDCTQEDEVDENPPRLGEEQGVISATTELDEYLALPQMRDCGKTIHTGLRSTYWSGGGYILAAIPM